jgi:hypothetical protein
MRSFHGASEFGAAALGQLGGGMLSPESWIGLGAKGASWLWRVGKAGLQQGAIPSYKALTSRLARRSNMILGALPSPAAQASSLVPRQSLWRRGPLALARALVHLFRVRRNSNRLSRRSMIIVPKTSCETCFVPRRARSQFIQSPGNSALTPTRQCISPTIAGRQIGCAIN